MDAIRLFAVPLAWATLAIQLIVVPFYNKGELLHKDYWASGKINSAIAAIETGALIPSLARMFNLAADHQTDKRRRPEREMEALLQDVEFRPDLEAAQEAMSSMEGIKDQYRWLKLAASRLWKSGLVHAIATPCLPAVYVFLVPIGEKYYWLLGLVGFVWLLSLLFSGWGFVRFHSHLERFNQSLELDVVEGV